jgi:hypothetical protein
MLELTTVAYLAGMTLALLGADSYFNADTARFEVHVHPGAQPAGYTEVVATRIIDHELRRIFDASSVMRVPHVRIQSDNSLVSVIAKAARVDQLQYAMQDLLRIDPLSIRVAIYPPPSPDAGVVLHAFGSRPSGDTFDIAVPGVRGDARASLRAIAAATALVIDPYHTRLQEFRVITSDASIALYRAGYTPNLPDEKREAIQDFERRLRDALQAASPADAVRAAPDFNLLGVARWWLGDTAGAEAAFRRAIDLDADTAAAHLNLSWVLSARGDVRLASHAMQAVQRGVSASQSTARQTLTSAHQAQTAILAQADGRHEAARRAWNEMCGRGMQPAFISIYLNFRSTATPAASRCARALGAGWQNAALYEAKELLASELIVFAPRRGRD